MENSENQLDDKVEIYNKVSVLNIFTILNIQTFIVYLYVIYFADILQISVRPIIMLYFICIVLGVISYYTNNLRIKEPWITISKDGIKTRTIQDEMGKWESFSKITFRSKQMFLTSKDEKETLSFIFAANTAVNKREMIEAINKYKSSDVEVVDDEDIYINYTSKYLLLNYIKQAVVVFIVELILLYTIRNSYWNRSSDLGDI